MLGYLSSFGDLHIHGLDEKDKSAAYKKDFLENDLLITLLVMNGRDSVSAA